MAIKRSVVGEDDKSAIFKILADRNRYRVIVALTNARAGMSVTDLANKIGMTHSALSHLLGRLHDVGIVEYKKYGRAAMYAIAKTPQAKRVLKIVRLV